MTTYDAAVSYDEPITYDHFTAVVGLSGSTSASSERLSTALTAFVGSSTSQGSMQRLPRRSRGRSVGSSSVHAFAPRISKAGTVSISGAHPSKRVSKNPFVGSSVATGALLKRAGIAISAITSSFSESTLFLTTSYVGVLESFKSLSKRTSIDFESSSSFSALIYKTTVKAFSSSAFSSTEQAKSVSKVTASSIDVFGNRSTFISKAFTSVLTAFTDISKIRVNISKGMNIRSYIANKYRLHTNQNYDLETK